MKKLSIFVIALLGFQMSALADAKTMVNYNFGYELQPIPSNYSYESVNVAIDESGLLTVTSTNMESFNHVGPVNTKTHQLSEASLKFVRNELLSLSDAEIETYESEVVCMIAVSPAQMTDHLSVASGWDWQKKTFTGESRLVLGPEGCWVRSHTFPKSEWKANAARGLKKLLKFMALDIGGEFLK